MPFFEAAQYSKSFHAQDLTIYELFRKKWENVEGVFIDVGAKDGIETSNTYLFEQYLGWSGICFEPHPASFFKCKMNRKAHIYPIGISKEGGTREFFCAPVPGMSGIVDNFDPEHRSCAIYHAYKSPTNVIEIGTAPLQTVLDAHQYRHIHLLDVDTEGGEWEILQSVDYTKTCVDVILVENIFSKDKIRNFLKQLDFVLYHEFPYDDLFVRRDFYSP